MGNITNYAETELALIGMGSDSEDVNRLMHDNVMAIVEMFSEQGHSGFSASYLISVVGKLMAMEPLSPLTGDDDEWNEVENDTWQNRRCSHVFKEADGKAYDIEGKIFKDPDGSTWTNGGSRVFIEFPYVPKREYVERSDQEITN